MRRRSEKQARRRERLPADALIAGVDLAKKEAVVVYVRASDRARVGKLVVSSDRAGRAKRSSSFPSPACGESILEGMSTPPDELEDEPGR